MREDTVEIGSSAVRVDYEAARIAGRRLAIDKMSDLEA
jgi:hypothetical protein